MFGFFLKHTIGLFSLSENTNLCIFTTVCRPFIFTVNRDLFGFTPTIFIFFLTCKIFLFPSVSTVFRIHSVYFSESCFPSTCLDDVHSTSLCLEVSQLKVPRVSYQSVNSFMLLARILFCDPQSLSLSIGRWSLNQIPPSGSQLL